MVWYESSESMECALTTDVAVEKNTRMLSQIRIITITGRFERVQCTAPTIAGTKTHHFVCVCVCVRY